MKTNYNRGQYWIEVSVDDLQSHDEAQMRSEAQAHNANYQRLSDKLRESPTDAIEIVSATLFFFFIKVFLLCSISIRCHLV